jgi:hypothetical protein
MLSERYVTGIRKTLTPVLVGFALISLGYGLGRVSKPEPGPGSHGLLSPPPAGRGAVVLFLHSTQRCQSCNVIQSVTGDLVGARPDALAAGTLAYRKGDYQKRPDLARRFDVKSSTVVVLEFRDGKMLGHRTLDSALAYWRDEQKLRHYIAGAIDEALAAGGDAAQ